MNKNTGVPYTLLTPTPPWTIIVVIVDVVVVGDW